MWCTRVVNVVHPYNTYIQYLYNNKIIIYVMAWWPMTNFFKNPPFFLYMVYNIGYSKNISERWCKKMAGKKEQLSITPVVFRVEQNIHEFIEEEMIRRREFNKSQITREIFLKGLELYKKENK